MTDLRELLQECHAEILFWLPHRDSPPNRSRLLLERIDATLAHLPTVPTRNAQPAQQPVACSMCQGRKVVGIPGVTCEWCDGTGIDKIASELKSRETRNAQGEVDGGYFAEGQAEQQGPQPAAPPTYAGPIWAPPEDWLKDHEIPALGSALQKLGSHLANMLLEDDWNNIQQMLFAVARESAAPQPPAGKGQEQHYTVLLGKLAEREQMWHDIGAICASGWTRDNEARSPNEWAEALLHDRDELRDKLADAIPREIHDRLVRDAKREALREAADWFESCTTADGTYWPDAVWQELRRMASEHERGGK